MLSLKQRGKKVYATICTRPVYIALLTFLCLYNLLRSSQILTTMLSPFDQLRSSTPNSGGGEQEDVSKSTKDRNKNDVKKRLETAVIILTTLIPSHPSIWMLEKTIGSLKNLNGLHPKMPLYITVDVPKSYSIENAERLDLYTQALYHRFSGEENWHVTIVANHINRHITGTIRKVVFDLINTNVTKYIYVLQHDLMFLPGKVIEHTALVDAFDKYFDNNTVCLVGFGQHVNRSHLRKGNCEKRTELEMENPLKIFVGGVDNTTNTSKAIYLTHTRAWSDNNHFTTVEYYRTVLNELGSVPRPPEGPMQVRAGKNCLLWGTHFYGEPSDGQYICHLDGRNSTSGRYNDCPDEYRDRN